MALVAINPSVEFEYSLINDIAEPKTVFKLGVLDIFTRAFLDDTHLGINRDDESLSDVAIRDKYLQFIRFGLRGWSNFKDEHGNEVEFTTEEVAFPRIGKRRVVSDASLNRIDSSWVPELVLQILTHNSLRAAELKN